MTNWMAREGARLVDNGYRILPVWPGQKAPAVFASGAWREMAEWTRFCARQPTEIELDHWSGFPACSIGIAGGNVVGIDIDLLDAALSFNAGEICRHVLGDTPALRFGLKPKRLLVYRTDKPFYSFQTGPIQILCLGRQFVGLGRHPDTGQDYQWPVATLSEIPIDQLPTVSEAMVRQCLDQIVKILPPELRVTRARQPGPGGPKDRATREALVEALRFVPLSPATSYHFWLDIGMALHEATGGEGLDLWHEWSAQEDRYKPKVLDSKWASFGGYGGERVGAGTIFEEARRNGWTPSPGLNLRAADAEIAEAVQVDFAAILSSSTALTIVENALPAAEPQWSVPAGIPAWRRDLTGGLKMFVDHADASAKSPQPWLALGAGLAAFGVLAGRRYAGPTDLRTNLYTVGIAESTGGKDHPLRCITALLMAAERLDMIGGSKIASGAAMMTALERAPSVIFPTDEIGFLMQAVADRKKAPKHATEIIDNLTELYSSAPHLFHGTAYANAKEKPRAPIHQPNFVLAGVTTPNVFWSALSSAHVADGSLARLLVFESDNPFPDRKRDRSTVMPADLVMVAKAVAAGAEGYDAFPSGNCAAMAPRPYIVPYEDSAAEARSYEIEDYGVERCRIEKRLNPASNRTSIIGRLAENAFKVALVRAIANNPAAPRITVADLEWAYDIAELSMNAVLTAVDNTIADTPAEVEVKKMLRVIGTAGSAGIVKGDLINATRDLQKRRRDDILTDLQDAGRVRIESVPTGGRPRVVIYAQ